MPTRRIPLIAIVALLAVACGTAGGGTGSTAPGLAGTLVGAGASSQAAAMDGWKAGFAEVEPGVTVEYDPIGSGGGRSTFLAGGSDFAGSDSPLKAEEFEQSLDRCGPLGAISVPHYISPIAIAYNLPSVGDTVLQLSPETVAGIFANQIVNWNDPKIAADNPGVDLPDLAINPVHRSDESGTSANFTDYLAQAAPAVWTWGSIEVWDEGPGGGEGADGTSGVVAAIRAGEGSIGYADASQIGDLPAAAVGVGGGFVRFSPEAAGRIVDSSERVSSGSEWDYAIEVNRTPDNPDTYPIALVSYHIFCLEYEDQAKADLVKAFMGWVGSEDGQAAAAASAGSAPISDAVRDAIARSIDQVTVADG
ncbi:MAG TPA: phosphate ABC transporter substrate-binding protein PstS [Acidimicrobiia bacterium]|jgi:phosphate transport system substrate-binding protein|nr:MAG: phosphate ABC transporter substrate-binding protein PstS [Actinomycetota bacterium]HLV90910.1 phosphate ABC transporter substrate-binding protein PstS [Acidimicrobiia bacterium]